VDEAHSAEIFALVPTAAGLVSSSGSSALHIHSLHHGDFGLRQTLHGAHKLGCHHLAASRDGNQLVSIGFGGDAKFWTVRDGSIIHNNATTIAAAGDIWAVALSSDGQCLATSSYNGKIHLWSVPDTRQTGVLETKGSFALTVDISNDRRFVASGHQNGGLYIFDIESERLRHSLPSLTAPVRCARFSPGCRYLAACGDARVITLYEVETGEHIANLQGHQAWIMSLDWSYTGEYLLTGSFDGKTKVWSVEQRKCVATHSETEKSIWAVKWLPRLDGKAEMFAVAGANRSISFYREASGG